MATLDITNNTFDTVIFNPKGMFRDTRLEISRLLQNKARVLQTKFE